LTHSQRISALRRSNEELAKAFDELFREKRNRMGIKTKHLKENDEVSSLISKTPFNLSHLHEILVHAIEGWKLTIKRNKTFKSYDGEPTTVYYGHANEETDEDEANTESTPCNKASDDMTHDTDDLNKLIFKRKGSSMTPKMQPKNMMKAFDERASSGKVKTQSQAHMMKQRKERANFTQEERNQIISLWQNANQNQYCAEIASMVEGRDSASIRSCIRTACQKYQKGTFSEDEYSEASKKIMDHMAERGLVDKINKSK
jgi:hypothetical protein